MEMETIVSAGLEPCLLLPRTRLVLLGNLDATVMVADLRLDDSA
jgi:hypothetical protein